MTFKTKKFIITLEGGEKIEPKIPEEEEDSLEPNNSFVNEEEEPVCFLPSIFSLGERL